MEIQWGVIRQQVKSLWGKTTREEVVFLQGGSQPKISTIGLDWAWVLDTLGMPKDNKMCLAKGIVL